MTALNEENPCKTRVFDSSEGGTRTRDPRLMKPVPSGESVDVTDNPDNGLRNQQGKAISAAQQKAQQTEIEDNSDPVLKRLINAWRALGYNDRSAVVEQAVRLAETNNVKIEP